MSGPSMNRLMPAYLVALVAITGGVVLSLEVLGTRVIGTYYGSSLYVWAALLTVTLACLAVGYALGGLLADRRPQAWLVCLLVMLAGASVLAVPRLTGVLAPLDAHFGFVWGAIASALVIFGAPLTLLAMTGPFVIRLLTRRVQGAGQVSGAVYALSTVGSVAGVLAVSLWMIPGLGTRLSLLICAALLIGWAAIGLVVASRGKGSAALLLAAGPWLLGGGDWPRLPGELYRTESPYGELTVIDRGQGSAAHRMLLVNGIMQTGMPLDMSHRGQGSSLGSDHYHLELLPFFHDDLGEGRSGLLIGLAGGQFARVMDFYDIDWTAVEIDRKVAEIAVAYFGYRGRLFTSDGREIVVEVARFPNRDIDARQVGAEQASDGDDDRAAASRAAPPRAHRGRAIIQDGRRYLIVHPQPVDFIVLDAYNSDTIPFHLATREFYHLVCSRLTDDGIFAINYIGPPTNDFVTDSLYRTLADVFGRDGVSAYRSGEDETSVQVVTIFAMRRPRAFSSWRLGSVGGGAHNVSYDLSRRKVAIDFDSLGGVVVTDDSNPLDRRRAATALSWRRQTMAALAASERN